jgi:glycosyltransferase involved in cell wall biosynthesis
MSTVDIVIPCYNYARYLRGCVQSVLSQPGVTVRVLIIDDASSDDTAEVGHELAATDSRVEFRRHNVNHGHIATYNEGLMDWSTATYCVLLSADDMLAPGSLMRAARIMNADENIGMVYGRAIHFARETELPSGSATERGYVRFAGTKWIEARCRAGYNVISSPEVVVRRSVQRAIGGYRPELPHSGDLEMWLRVAAVSDIAYIAVPQAFYRVHQASMFRTKYLTGLLDIRQRKAAFDSFFLHANGTIADGKSLQYLANCALAREALWDACRAYDHNRIEEGHLRELLEFAQSTYPDAISLPEYSALCRRRTLGPAICNRTQLFLAAAVARRLRRWYGRRRRERLGI